MSYVHPLVAGDVQAHRPTAIPAPRPKEHQHQKNHELDVVVSTETELIDAEDCDQQVGADEGRLLPAEHPIPGMFQKINRRARH